MSLNCLVHCLNQRATCAVQYATTLRTHSGTRPFTSSHGRDRHLEAVLFHVKHERSRGGIVRNLTVMLDTVSGTNIRQPLAVHGPKVAWSNSTPI